MLRGNVLITGGAGFLGRGIMRRAARDNWPCSFTVFSRDEQKQEVCKRRYPDAEYVLGDIRDVDRLALAMRRHGTVIHAAALKYVPEAEFNVNECIGINVGGTQSVIAAARHANVAHTVFISTDKAVEPLNTYGLTKALGERLFAEAAEQDAYVVEYNWHTCRYGNVIGSTGSVVPLLKQLHARDGSVPITDPSMTRFWISIDDAVDLILSSLNALSGELVVPQPKALSIGDLAKAVCGDDVRMDIVGARPGERKHERLLSTSEGAKAVLNGDGYYRYHRTYDDNAEPVALNSRTAELMAPAEFARLAEDAESV